MRDELKAGEARQHTQCLWRGCGSADRLFRHRSLAQGARSGMAGERPAHSFSSSNLLPPGYSGET